MIRLIRNIFITTVMINLILLTPFVCVIVFNDILHVYLISLETWYYLTNIFFNTEYLVLLLLYFVLSAIYILYALRDRIIYKKECSPQIILLLLLNEYFTICYLL